ncbi:hypothetical protein JCM8547_002553 [Rhodosporidiobolus lusitaniae]
MAQRTPLPAQTLSTSTFGLGTTPRLNASPAPRPAQRRPATAPPTANTVSRQSDKRPRTARPRPPQLHGKWEPTLPSAGGKGRGCAHYVYSDPEARSKVAALDLDGTVIRPLEGRTFPQSASDWEWCGEGVTRKIRETYKAGFSILLISNQASPTSKLSLDFARKLPVICRKLNVPLRAFAAFEFDEYRKPAGGMWEGYLGSREDGGRGIDYEKSFYVGDAAGRPQDHADTDRKFALNAGLPFLTPEQFFDGETDDGNWTLWGGNPLAWDHSQPDPPPVFARPEEAQPELGDYEGPEVVLLVGPPAVGKTKLYRERLEAKGFEHVTYTSAKPPPQIFDALRLALEPYYAAFLPPVVPPPFPPSASSDLPPPFYPASTILPTPPDTSPDPAPFPLTAQPPLPPAKLAIEAPFASRSSRVFILKHLRHFFPVLSSTHSSCFSSPSPSSPSFPLPVRISCVYFSDSDAVEIGKHNSVYRASLAHVGAGDRGGAGEERGRGQGLVPLKEFQKWEREWEAPEVREGFSSLHPTHFRFTSPSPTSLSSSPPTALYPSPPHSDPAFTRWNRFLTDVYPGKAWKTGRVAMRGPGAREGKEREGRPVGGWEDE